MSDNQPVAGFYGVGGNVGNTTENIDRAAAHADNRSGFEKWVDSVAEWVGKKAPGVLGRVVEASAATASTPQIDVVERVRSAAAEEKAKNPQKFIKKDGTPYSDNEVLGIAGGEAMATPYRRLIAQPLSTAFLLSNDAYTNQTGNGSIFDAKTWSTAWHNAEHVSPGQSLVGAIGSAVDGKQGTDKLDWTDQAAVSAYFNHGPQRWISFGTDFASAAFLDPTILAGKGIGSARRLVFTVPVTTKSMPIVVEAIDAATSGTKINNWSIVTDFLKKNADDKTAILAHPIVAGNTELADVLISSAKRANQTGNDAIIGQALKIAIGDSKSIDNAIYDSTFLSSDIAALTKKKAAIEEQLANPTSPPIGSKIGLLNIQRQNAVKNIENRLSESNSDLNVMDKLSTQTLGTIQQQTVSRFGRIERARANSAVRFSESYWSQDIGLGARVSHYLEPSSMLHEKPSGFAEVGGIVGDRSHLEFAARLRQWAKINNKSMDVAKKYFNLYMENPDKTSRYQMLMKFDEKAMRDTIITNLKKTGPVTGEEAKMLIEFSDMIAKNSKLHKSALIQRIVDENYTIVDETGSQVFLKHLKDYETSAAKEIARSRAGAGATVTASDIAAAKQVVKDSLSGVITKTSQLPNVHYGVNLEKFNSIVMDHRVEFRAMLEDIRTNPRLQNLDIKKLFDEFSKSKSSDLLFSEKIQNIPLNLQAGMHIITNTLDSFYNNIWKPVTLASLHYTSRNVLEGWQRVLSVALETSRDTGMSVSSILRDSLEPTGGLAIKIKDSASRFGRNVSLKTDASKARKILNNSRKQLVNEEYKYNVELSDALYSSSDSVHTSLIDALSSAERIVQNYSRPTIIATQLQKKVVANMQSMLYRIGDETTLPLGVNKELFNALVDLDHIKTFDILSSVDDKYILSTLGELQQRITKQRSFIETVVADKNYKNLPNGMKQDLSLINARLNNMEVSIGSTATASIAKASARGKLEDLIKPTDVLHNIEKSAQGKFEIIPGLYAQDAFGGVMGEIMRSETSAIKNSTAAIFNLDRATLGQMLHGKTQSGIINPFITDEVTGIRTTNTNWAEIAADHANRQTRDVTIQKLMKIDVTNPDEVSKVVKWAKSSDPEAVRWRNLERISIGVLRDQGFKNPIRHLIERNAFFVDGHMPEIGIDGRIIAPAKDSTGNLLLDSNGNHIPSLREKAMTGELTAEDMLKIPEAQRTSTFGNTIVEGNTGLWKAATQQLFKHLGSNPETYLVRHPFYTMMYRTELRRLANNLKAQGRSLDYIDTHIGSLETAAHKFAYKNIMEKLYSIERKTDPGSTMRFLSPFYMAKQNSNRFWFGYYKRNPQALARYFQLWSAPGRVFDVEDNNGRNVKSVNPFASAGASMMITLPQSIANALGIPPDSRLRIPISSFDLINNGVTPFAPELGGPVFTYGMGHLLDRASGTPYDPELLMTKLGINPSMFTKTILPFYQPDKQTSARDSWLNAIIDTNSWMDSVLRAGSTKSGIAVIPNLASGNAAKDAFNARLFKNYILLQEDWMNGQDKFAQLSQDEQSSHVAEMLSKAASYTTQEYLVEAFISGGPTVGNGKIEDRAVRLGTELRQYQKQYGYDEGQYRYIKYLESKTNLDTAVSDIFISKFKPREVNMFGVISTPQTVYNISQNKALWDTVSGMSSGKDSIADNKLIGSLFNGGDALTDYTATANEKLYHIGVKQTITDPKKLAQEALIESGTSKYFTYIDYYKAEGLTHNPPLVYGSSEFNKVYGPKIEARKKEIENLNPGYKIDQVINLGKSQKNINIIYTVINNKDFVNSVGKTNPLIPALTQYMAQREKLVAERLKLSQKEGARIYDSKKYSSLIVKKEAMVTEIIKNHPEFKDFYDFFLSKDPLMPATGHAKE